MMQMMQMAQMAQMAAAASGVDPSNPASNPAMQMMQMMGIPGMGGPTSNSGYGGSETGDGDPNRRDSAVTNRNQSFQQQQFQKQMKTMMTNMQIARTVATSETLNNLTDEQVAEISAQKFTTAKDFMNFMKSANTEVGNLFS